MITAYGEVESYLEAMNMGAFEYINKPVRVNELKRVITKVLEERHKKAS
jgi:DNA-binding NtrC family response regulator